VVNYLAEMARQAQRAQTETHEMIAACFERAILRVGEAKARELFREVTKRKRGKPRGTTNAARDAELVIWYDEFVLLYPSIKQRQRAPHLIGDWLAKMRPKKYGPSAGAIETRLRRCLRSRRRQLPPSGTENALAEFTRTGVLPMLELPSDRTK
jgi:hypothetical protein